jgi:AAA15 family ATPase/GTPase
MERHPTKSSPDGATAGEERPKAILPVGSVELENFRGIRPLQLALHPRITVLFGAIAAGKATILDALSIGLGPISSRYPGGKGRGFKRNDDIRIP